MEVLQELGRHLVFPIDFESQKSTETFSNYALYITTTISCLVGFFTQSLLIGLILFATGYVVTLLAVVPAYPKFNKNKPQWVKAQLPSVYSK